MHVREIIEGAAAAEAPAGSEEQQIGDAYASFMDTDAIEAAGVEPLLPLIERIAAVGDREDLLRLMGEFGREGIGGLLGAGVWIDRGNPERYLIHLGQSGLGLPDESYYRLEEHAEIRSSYIEHMARMLVLTEVAPTASHAEAMADQIMALETQIAQAHWDRTAMRDTVKTYNLTAADDLESTLPGAGTWLGAMGVAASARDEVVVGQPDVIEAMSTLLDSVQLDEWKGWLSWRVVRGMSRFLTEKIVQESFDFYGRTLTGAPELRPRWKRGVALVEGLLGELVGRMYVERHYPERAQEQMSVLIDNLIRAYDERITSLDWMETETQGRAIEKLRTFTPKVGKPVKWKDYSALEIAADDLLGNVRRANALESDRELAKLSGPIDRDEWFMTPQTVNAYYNPTMNEIVFPAAILQTPFFDAERDAAYNYGGIGAVIGHEIGHGFDDQGSRFGGDGSLQNWWTDTDREQFDTRVQALIEQYDVYSPRDVGDEHTVNGALTVGENIGDLGGVAVAFHAYRLFVDEELGGEAPVIGGLTGDQRFFIGWSSVWRVVSREQEVVRRLTMDPHSPPEFRANVVRNVDAFHEAFQTTESDELWLDPADRVDIW